MLHMFVIQSAIDETSAYSIHSFDFSKISNRYPNESERNMFVHTNSSTSNINRT